MAILGDIVLDCRHPASLARFWAAAMDGYRVAAYDDEELARLAATGIHDPEDDPSVLVEPESGSGVRMFLTAVPEPKSVKNRMHLDLLAPDVAAEAARLVELGAAVRERTENGVLLVDPEGNEFDILPSHGSH